MATALTLLATVLVAVAVADAAYRLIPDGFCVAVLLGGLCTAVVLDRTTLLDRTVAVMVGYIALRTVAQIYYRLRGRDGLGFGDIKLFAAGGAWVQLTGLPSVLVWAGVLGLVVTLAGWARGDRTSGTTELAFGPYLACGIWLVAAFGPAIG